MTESVLGMVLFCNYDALSSDTANPKTLVGLPLSSEVCSAPPIFRPDLEDISKGLLLSFLV